MLRKCSAISFAMLFCTSSANAQHPANMFWITGEVRQGISKADFDVFAKRKGISVTNPLPTSKDLFEANLAGVDYWLVFCRESLTYASWNIDNNTQFIKSMNQNVKLGFALAKYEVESNFDDRGNKDVSTLTLQFTHPDKNYSVTYILHDNNGQVVLEDVRFDDSYGCQGDPT